MNATYKLDPDKLVYFTWSRGFRPGGINRRGGVPYDADFLVNYEVGFKTSWLDRRVRWNGAFYWSNWKDFQFPFLGQNGLTVITNAGNARIRGFETDWQATLAPGLTFAGVWRSPTRS
ncbi:TonB-dependent receptor domain-containing protein [Hankyongella ginsenosidimutans]|uniref:TonB-dependent receptor domain-containing protein n=1 Tax=Hankyongella ginsenosidimutans TaxID=1763828 RepID=UPI0024825FC8|nr:TonB-dependent receptor [Hankyongella ginsenosidimutans]